MYVVSFTDFVPERRFDNISWSQVTVQEAPEEDGPYTLIDTISVGVDPDPSHPAARNFTTNKATLVEGWYLITFEDATGSDQSPVAPVHREASADASYVPTIQQVANKLLARTRDQYGNQLGTFNGLTVPTDSQVAAMANEVVTEISDIIGDDIPEKFYDDAQNVVAIRTAMEIETSYYAEQVANNRSPYPLLEKQYADALAKLSAAIQSDSGGTDVDPGAAAGSPSYSFPTATLWLDRRM
jgi:hypothetical protein